MKTHFLFPNQFKIIGWFLFVPSVIITILISSFGVNIDEYLNVTVFAVYANEFISDDVFLKFIKNSIVDELLTLSMIIGGILIDGLSRIDWAFITDLPSRKAEKSGIWTPLMGSVWILVLTAIMTDSRSCD